MNLRALAAALIGGILFPQGHPYTYLVRYLVMGMLFFAFLEMKLNQNTLKRSHLYVLIANISIAFLGFGSLLFLHRELALVAFITGIMPTAAGAPVITNFLRGDVGYVTFSTLFTTIVIALLLPVFLPLIHIGSTPITPLDLLIPVLSLLFVPLGMAFAIRALSSGTARYLLKYRSISFWLFLASIYLAMSKASHYIQNELPEDWTLLLWIALLSGFLCLLNFQLGERLGGKKYSLEGSMALGRKNTMFSVWVALTFLSPLSALGPMFYIIWQNAYNYQQLRKQKNSP